MNITFGLALDGWVSNAGYIPVNHLYCGLAGLLSTLELRLGLSTPVVSHARRIVAYHLALRQSATAPRFFSASFSKDALGTAETLLVWRDELRLAGWSGLPVDSLRLDDLAAVEALVPSLVATGFGDRLAAVLEVMEQRDPLIESVEVIEESAHLPQMLRQVLNRLNATYGKWALVPAAPDGSNLRRVQESLISGSASRITWNPAADDSVRLCCAFSEVTLAQVAAQLIQANVSAAIETTVVATAPARPLEDALLALNEPVTGVASRSVHRALLQVLPLALRLRWAPLDPRHLIEFLAHPVSPVQRGLRNRLTKIVANYPGIGSPAWAEAIQNYENALKQKHAAMPAELAGALKRVETDVALWLTPLRFERSEGAPGKDLAETCDHVARWAETHFGITTNSTLAAQFRLAAAQASELAVNLREFPIVTPVQLELLSKQVQGSGVASGVLHAEVGCVLMQKPAAMIESTDAVIWWGFEETPLRVGAPWTRAEAAALAAVGAEVLTASARFAWANAAAMRPILAARQRVILLLPYTRGNASVGHHPLHDRLDALIEGKLPVEDIDSQLALGALIPTATALSYRPLAEQRRWWRVSNPNFLARRTTESYSSLTQFISQPFAWVFSYKAKLERGVLSHFELVAGVRQRGNLLHRVVEILFGPNAGIAWQAMSEQTFGIWLTSLWGRLLETEGANLLMAGNRTDGQRLEGEAHRAIWTLVKGLRAAGVVNAYVSVKPDGVDFENSRLGGIIDLEAETAVGQRAIVDLKYGGLSRRTKELAENLHLQLAVYGYMGAANNNGRWPESAYFILNPPQLLALTSAYFPTARVARSKGNNPGMASCWAEFEAVWKWRRKQFDAGWIELPIAGTTTTDGSGLEPASTPPFAPWQHDDIQTRYDEFTALTGWGAKQ